jgi:hypothetical protein
MNSFQAIYDVNSAGNPFHKSIYEHQHYWLNTLAGLPQVDGIQHTNTIPAVTETQEPALLRRFANFFRPNSITRLPGLLFTHNNDTFGNTMPIPAPANTTRLYFINLNGLNLQKNAVKFCDLCEELRTSNVNLFAATEHNLDTNKFAVRASLQDI